MQKEMDGSTHGLHSSLPPLFGAGIYAMSSGCIALSWLRRSLQWCSFSAPIPGELGNLKRLTFFHFNKNPPPEIFFLREGGIGWSVPLGSLGRICLPSGLYCLLMQGKRSRWDIRTVGVRLGGGLTTRMLVILRVRRTVFTVFSSAVSTRHTPRTTRFGLGAAAAVATATKMGDEKEQQRQFWLMKTEPDVWSWQNQKENSGLSVWDGVRNAQAQKHMKSMRVDDLCLFYHTGKLKEVVGVVRVVKTFYPDPTDDTGKWGAVDVQEVEALKQAVTLAQMKADDHFKGFLMLRQPRLSVVHVDESIWERVCELGGLESAKCLGVKENGKSGGGSVKMQKKVEAGRTEKGLPTNGGKTSNRKSKESTTDKGSAEIKQAKGGARKRGAKEVNETPKSTKTSHNNMSEVEEAPSGSRTPKTRKKKPS